MEALVKCKCQHCGQNIEFDSDSGGATIACPHCGLETQLFVPENSPKSTIKTRTPYETKEARHKTLTNIGKLMEAFYCWLIQATVLSFSLAMFCIGLGLVIGGCGGEHQEATDVLHGSAIRQNVYVMQYCAGFILMGLSPIVFTAARLIAWFRENGGKK